MRGPFLVSMGWQGDVKKGFGLIVVFCIWLCVLGAPFGWGCWGERVSDVVEGVLRNEDIGMR